MVSLLLALNRFHKLFSCFHRWLWTTKCRLQRICGYTKPWKLLFRFHEKTIILSFIFSYLTLNVPCISESCIEIKIKLNFYFHTSLWCFKRVYEGLKDHYFKPICNCYIKFYHGKKRQTSCDILFWFFMRDSLIFWRRKMGAVNGKTLKNLLLKQITKLLNKKNHFFCYFIWLSKEYSLSLL